MNPYNKEDQQKLRKDVIDFFTTCMNDKDLLFGLGGVRQKQLEQQLAHANELEKTILYFLEHIPTDK